MVVFTPHGMSFMFSFIFGNVHGRVVLGFYWCVWSLLSWALLVFIIMLSWALSVRGHALLSSVGVCGRVLLGSIGVPSHSSSLNFVGVLGHCFLGLLMFMIVLSQALFVFLVVFS
jgi:hypothetical protein